MKYPKLITGYSSNGLPYARIDGGPQTLIIFEGISFNHKPPSGMMLRWFGRSYKNFSEHFTVYRIGRKPGLPGGYSIRDMSDDYAIMVKNEIRAPIDLMGISTGGPMAQQFSVDHPELVHRLILASTGYQLSEEGAKIQRQWIDLTRQGKWRSAAAMVASKMTSGVARPLMSALAWLMGRGMFGSPVSPSDGIVELEAEEKFSFKDHLRDIRVPTLVIGGENDCFYLIRETAREIPSAKLVLYENAGHAAITKGKFYQDILKFLTEP